MAPSSNSQALLFIPFFPPTSLFYGDFNHLKAGQAFTSAKQEGRPQLPFCDVDGVVQNNRRKKKKMNIIAGWEESHISHLSHSSEINSDVLRQKVFYWIS